MDRYQMAREFELVKMLDNIQAVTDADELKEIALGLAKLNYGLREYIAQYRQRFLDSLQELREERDREMEGITDRDERQAIRDAPVDPELRCRQVKVVVDEEV